MPQKKPQFIFIVGESKKFRDQQLSDFQTMYPTNSMVVQYEEQLPDSKAKYIILCEPENGLHPNFQRQITSNLKNKYPNSTFCISTNSAFVLQADNGIVLKQSDGDTVKNAIRTKRLKQAKPLEKDEGIKSKDRVVSGVLSRAWTEAEIMTINNSLLFRQCPSLRL